MNVNHGSFQHIHSSLLQMLYRTTFVLAAIAVSSAAASEACGGWRKQGPHNGGG